MEDAYIRDPFYGNSEALLDILREVGYDMPEDYLNNLDSYDNYIGRNKDYVNKASAPILREIPVKAWVWRNNNGSGNISLSEVREIIEIVNDLFAINTNIRFYLLCDISEINNTDYANNADANFDSMVINYKTSNAINTHFVIDDNANPSWAGLANFPFNPISPKKFTCAITERHSSFAAAITLAHEFGHTLGLYHTHHPGRSWSHSNNGGCGDCHQESVSRTKRQELGCISTYNELKCNVNGDFLCDTAADPELLGLVNYLCVYDSSSGGTDNWGEVWTPNVNNLMSYSYFSCRNQYE